MDISEEEEYGRFVKEAKRITRCVVCGKETDSPKIFGKSFYCDDCYYLDVEMVGDAVGI